MNTWDPTARSWVEIDLGNLRHNLEALSALLPEGCELMPAVKADAYGHGAAAVARELQRLGVGRFCVATAREGVELRWAGIRGEILVLGYTHPGDFALLNRYGLSQAILDADYARCLSDAGEPVTAHLAVDTGMHRVGLDWERLDKLQEVFALPHLRIDGIFTHLCADDTDRPEDRAFTDLQAARFRGVVERLRELGIRPKAHLLDSYGLLHYPRYGGDFARVGIALYGVLGSDEDLRRCPVNLRPVLSWKARVASVRRVWKGESVGYGLAQTAREDTLVATLAVGYADGLPRSLSCGRGAVLLHGRRAPVFGRICMDQTMVDVGGIPEVRAGDTAVLIGEDGGQWMTAGELAEADGTIANEILSRLGPRLERVYVNGAC